MFYFYLKNTYVCFSKKIIIKVPKKINHVHHHHVKKVHIWKHKPKPIHSVHIEHEEEEHYPVGDWKEKSHHKKHKFNGWKAIKPTHEHWDEEEEEEEEYEEDFEEEVHKKSGSHHDPIVWKGRGSGGKKWRESSAIKGRSRTKPKGGNYKGDRAKRQKSHLHYDERYREESRYNDSRQPKGKKPKKTKGKSNKGNKYDRKPRPKPKPYRPIDKGSFGGVEYDDSEVPVWPERKEHISWHTWSHANEPPQVTEEPYFYPGEYQPEHKGVIDLSESVMADIPIVPPPNLVPQHHVQAKGEMKPRHPTLPKTETKQKKPKHEVKKPPPPPQPLNKDQLRTQLAHEQGVLSGYTSHVGHNAQGDSASFQSVRFGEKHPIH